MRASAQAAVRAVAEAASLLRRGIGAAGAPGAAGSPGEASGRPRAARTGANGGAGGMNGGASSHATSSSHPVGASGARGSLPASSPRRGRGGAGDGKGGSSGASGGGASASAGGGPGGGRGGRGAADGAASSSSASALGALSEHRAAKGRPSFAELVDASWMRPGTYRLSVGNACVQASVERDGSIVYAGARYRAISKFALVVLRERNPARQSCDGWKEVAFNGEKLDALRSRFLAARRRAAAAGRTDVPLPNEG